MLTCSAVASARDQRGEAAWCWAKIFLACGLVGRVGSPHVEEAEVVVVVLVLVLVLVLVVVLVLVLVVLVLVLVLVVVPL